jgi:hypothetical protein
MLYRLPPAAAPTRIGDRRERRPTWSSDTTIWVVGIQVRRRRNFF